MYTTAATRRGLLPLLLGCALLAVTGCSPCEESCRIQSRHFDRCLADWSMDWSDLKATDEKNFRKTCAADTKRYINSLDADARSSEQDACRGLNADLNLASDCEQSWEALSGYGQ